MLIRWKWGYSNVKREEKKWKCYNEFDKYKKKSEKKLYWDELWNNWKIKEYLGSVCFCVSKVFLIKFEFFYFFLTSN